MEFLLAAPQHLEEMCRITDEAKAQLKRLELDQWQKGYQLLKHTKQAAKQHK